MVSRLTDSPLHQLWGLGSAISSPSGVRDEAKAAKSFGAFWILQVSSPAVLLLDLGVIHSSFCGLARKFCGWLAYSSCKISNYCGAKRYFRGSPPWFQRCGGERLCY